MNLINVIPIGKKYGETREELMYKAKITNVEEFKKELSKLRKKYIIIFDKGYYIPATKEEYQEFINKMKKQAEEIENTIRIAKNEMEEIQK